MRTNPPDKTLQSEQGVVVNLRSEGYAVDVISQPATYFSVNETRTHACTRVGPPALRRAPRLQGGLRDKRLIPAARRRATTLTRTCLHAPLHAPVYVAGSAGRLGKGFFEGADFGADRSRKQLLLGGAEREQ